MIVSLVSQFCLSSISCLFLTLMNYIRSNSRRWKNNFNLMIILTWSKTVAVVVVGSTVVTGAEGFCVVVGFGIGFGVVGLSVVVVGFSVVVVGFSVVVVVGFSVVVATWATTTSGAAVVSLFKPSLQMAPVTQNLGWTVMQIDCSASMYSSRFRPTKRSKQVRSAFA